MSESMVERVAKAIYAQWPTQFSTLEPTTDGSSRYERRYGFDTWETTCEIDPRRADECRVAARAVIAAMKEPTPEMVEALKGKLLREDWLPSFLEHWRAMIDAALQEDKG